MEPTCSTRRTPVIRVTNRTLFQGPCHRPNAQEVSFGGQIFTMARVDAYDPSQTGGSRRRAFRDIRHTRRIRLPFNVRTSWGNHRRIRETGEDKEVRSRCPASVMSMITPDGSLSLRLQSGHVWTAPWGSRWRRLGAFNVSAENFWSGNSAAANRCFRHQPRAFRRVCDALV